MKRSVVSLAEIVSSAIVVMERVQKVQFPKTEKGKVTPSITICVQVVAFAQNNVLVTL
jgi:hypothetical protein